jgi:hypothetical protein
VPKSSEHGIIPPLPGAQLEKEHRDNFTFNLKALRPHVTNFENVRSYIKIKFN